MSDTVFANKFKSYDVLVGMYHDQVLAPIKSIFGFNAINIASGNPYSIKETVEIIKNLSSSSKKVFFKKRNENDRSIDLDHCGDIYFAKKHLKWTPMVSFEDGLKDTINQTE